MKKTIKGATKSKLMYLSLAIGVLSPVLEYLPELKTLLADNYTIAFYSLSVTIAILRLLTTKSLSEK